MTSSIKETSLHNSLLPPSLPPHNISEDVLQPISDLRWSNLIHFFQPEDPNWQKMTLKAIRGLDTKEGVSSQDLLLFTSEQIRRLSQERRAQLHPGIVLDAIKIAKEKSSSTKELLALIPESFQYFSQRTAVLRTASFHSTESDSPQDWVDIHNKIDKELGIHPLQSPQSTLHAVIASRNDVSEAVCHVLCKEKYTHSSSWLKSVHVAHIVRQNFSEFENPYEKIQALLRDPKAALTSQHLLLFSPQEIIVLAKKFGTSIPQGCIKDAIHKSTSLEQKKALLLFLSEDYLKAILRYAFPQKQPEKLETVFDILSIARKKIPNAIDRFIEADLLTTTQKIDYQTLLKLPSDILGLFLQTSHVIDSFIILTAIRKSTDLPQQNILIELYRHMSHLEKDVIPDFLTEKSTQKVSFPAISETLPTPDREFPNLIMPSFENHTSMYPNTDFTEISEETSSIQEPISVGLPATSNKPSSSRKKEKQKNKQTDAYPLVSSFCFKNPAHTSIPVYLASSRTIQLSQTLRSVTKFREKQIELLDEAFSNDISKILPFFTPMNDAPSQLEQYSHDEKIDWQLRALTDWIYDCTNDDQLDPGIIDKLMELPLPELFKACTFLRKTLTSLYIQEPIMKAFAKKLEKALTIPTTIEIAIDIIHSMNSHREFYEDVLQNLHQL